MEFFDPFLKERVYPCIHPTVSRGRPKRQDCARTLYTFPIILLSVTSRSVGVGGEAVSEKEGAGEDGGRGEKKEGGRRERGKKGVGGGREEEEEEKEWQEGRTKVLGGE